MILVLLVLSGLSLTWITSVSDGQSSTKLSSAAAWRKATILNDAQQSLLSYSALYPFLYGPRGAGPGHLPCPDTDSTLNSAAAGGVSQIAPYYRGFSQDGPNPPCGSLSIATGQFPRHALLVSQKYLFHSEPDQRISYQVDSSWINNPTNRVVNVGMPDRSPDGSLVVVATMSMPAESDNKTVTSLPVYQRTLMTGLRPALAAWLMNLANKRLPETCRHSARRLGAENTSIPTAGAEHEQLPIQPCKPLSTAESTCVNDAVLRLLVDGIKQDSVCLDRQLQQLTIEDVPASQHWFVRNHWMDWISVSVSAACRELVNEYCHLNIEPDVANPVSAIDKRMLNLQWREL